jgi:AcrR family transcriptional regulator
MRKSKAKEKVLQIANMMFRKKGYAELNVNEIAHDADVSIGTLYYHFPEGKVSILMEIRKRTADQYLKNFEENLDLKHIQDASSFDQGLRLFLKNLIEIHRNARPLLAAMESEVLSNLISYDQVTDSISVEDLMESDAQPVTRVLKTLLEQHPEDGLSLDGQGAIINKVIDILIHRFVYVESIFGTEEKFIEMMITIVRSLLS